MIVRLPRVQFSLTIAVLVVSCLFLTDFARIVRGYVVVIDEMDEDPNFPGMCVSRQWDRIVPAGFSYPASRQDFSTCNEIGSSSSPSSSYPYQLTPRAPHPCEQVTCVKIGSGRHHHHHHHGDGGRFSLQIVGCENSLYNSQHDPNCDVYIPDQRLPYPLCCPQRSCPSTNYGNSFGGFGAAISPIYPLLRRAPPAVVGSSPLSTSSRENNPLPGDANDVRQRSTSAGKNVDADGLVEHSPPPSTSFSGGGPLFPYPLPPFPFAHVLVPTTKK